ncbi:MAG TPA: hotdog fold domain-containing protein [Acidimicrobiales bacterium]
MGPDSPFPKGEAPVPMAVPEPPVPSFEFHPGLAGRQPEAYELAQQLRRLIALSVSTAPSPEVTASLAAKVREVADEMERHRPEVPLPRFLFTAPEAGNGDIPLGGAMPYDPVVGPFNPVALPVRLAFDPPKAYGYATFGVAYEGAPGCVHGAALLATFDIILTGANAIAGAVGPTVRLGLHFQRPTLCYEEAVFEGWVTEVTDRRVFSKGRIVQGGVTTVEADGEFAILNREGVGRMASVRRQAFDTRERLAGERA